MSSTDSHNKTSTDSHQMSGNAGEYWVACGHVTRVSDGELVSDSLQFEKVPPMVFFRDCPHCILEKMKRAVRAVSEAEETLADNVRTKGGSVTDYEYVDAHHFAENRGALSRLEKSLRANTYPAPRWRGEDDQSVSSWAMSDDSDDDSFGPRWEEDDQKDSSEATSNDSDDPYVGPEAPPEDDQGDRSEAASDDSHDPYADLEALPEDAHIYYHWPHSDRRPLDEKVRSAWETFCASQTSEQPRYALAARITREYFRRAAADVLFTIESENGESINLHDAILHIQYVVVHLLPAVREYLLIWLPLPQCPTLMHLINDMLGEIEAVRDRVGVHEKHGILYPGKPEE